MSEPLERLELPDFLPDYEDTLCELMQWIQNRIDVLKKIPEDESSYDDEKELEALEARLAMHKERLSVLKQKVQ